MVKRKIVWTETAVKQRREILRYWTDRNKSTFYAEKLIALIRQRVITIQHNPLAFKATSYPETRESAMGHFSIYYKITDQEIIVTAFWDNRQDPAKVLQLLSK